MGSHTYSPNTSIFYYSHPRTEKVERVKPYKDHRSEEEEEEKLEEEQGRTEDRALEAENQDHFQYTTDFKVW